jgi:hypothetical protein
MKMGKCASNESVLAAVALQEKWQQKLRALYLDAREKSISSTLDSVGEEVSQVRELLSKKSLQRYRFRSVPTALQLFKSVCQRAEEDFSRAPISIQHKRFLEEFFALCLSELSH